MKPIAATLAVLAPLALLIPLHLARAAEEVMATGCDAYATCHLECDATKFGLDLTLEQGGHMVYCGGEDKTPDGPAILFYPEGGKAGEAHFKGGLLEGLYKRFDKKGRLASACTYEAGAKKGLCIEYYPSGSERRRTTYRAGKMDGPRRSFYPSGQPRVEITYDQGVLHGTWIEWSEEGEILRSCTYEKGELVRAPDQIGTCPEGSSGATSQPEGRSAS